MSVGIILDLNTLINEVESFSKDVYYYYFRKHLLKSECLVHYRDQSHFLTHRIHCVEKDILNWDSLAIQNHRIMISKEDFFNLEREMDGIRLMTKGAHRLLKYDMKELEGMGSPSSSSSSSSDSISSISSTISQGSGSDSILMPNITQSFGYETPTANNTNKTMPLFGKSVITDGGRTYCELQAQGKMYTSHVQSATFKYGK